MGMMSVNERRRGKLGNWQLTTIQKQLLLHNLEVLKVQRQGTTVKQIWKDQKAL